MCGTNLEIVSDDGPNLNKGNKQAYLFPQPKYFNNELS